MTAVTVEDLAQAISNRTDTPLEAAMGDANYVMDFFGYRDRIIDNMLESEDRQLFYMLEEENLLKTNSREVTIYDGRTWRIEYWHLRKDNILEYASLGDEEVAEEEGEKEGVEEKGEEGGIYEDIPDELWSDHR